jgi:hypothetical protein
VRTLLSRQFVLLPTPRRLSNGRDWPRRYSEVVKTRNRPLYDPFMLSLDEAQSPKGFDDIATKEIPRKFHMGANTGSSAKCNRIRGGVLPLPK